MPFKLLQTISLKYCADSVEWCPLLDFNNYFACGTYELQNEESQSKRVGQLHLFSIENQSQVILHCSINTSAILDMKWFSKTINEKILVVTCNADGRIILWEFVEGSADRLKHLCDYKINTEDVLSLSIDKSELDTPKLCVSDSQGFLTVLRLDNENNLHLMHRLKVNNYEAWIATFSLSNDSVIWTGGDDCLIKVFDLRCHPQFISKQEEHKSGVTSLRLNPNNTDILASGSYDENVKLWDTRNLKKSMSNCEIGGGIWRIKWNPHDTNHILIAAMYAGAYEVEYSCSTHSLELVNEMKEHESITYGADYSYISPDKVIGTYLKKDTYSDCIGTLSATCSFYDKKLCLCVL